MHMYQVPRNAEYKNVPLQKDEVFTLYIRNHPSHWLVHTSFDSNVRAIAATVNREYIYPLIREGAYFKRITLVSIPFLHGNRA